jgi:DNA/RNA endonuclease YhcR with UshA esterase domain
VIIFEKDLVNFKYNPSLFLKDKTICITGIVKMYNGLPEIIATKEEQIVIQ